MKRGTILDRTGRPYPTRRAHGSGYMGAGTSRARSYLPGFLSDSEREYVSFTRSELVRKAYFFKKNFGMIRGVAKSLVDHAIGPGIYPLPATPDDDWNEAAYKWFWEMAKIGDVSGKLTLWEAQAVRTRAKFYAGEMFTVHGTSALGWPQFQLVRAHNCGSFDVDSSAGWTDGIKLNGANRALAYRFRLRGEGRYATLPAARVVHSGLVEDGDEVRFVTPLAHAICNLHDILDSLSIEKEAMKENSRISHVIETESGEDEDDPSEHFRGGAAAAADPEAIAMRLEEVFGAEVKRLRKGEKLSQWASDRPSPAFTGFIDYLGKDVTTGSGFPYEFAWNPNGLTGPATRFVLEKVRLAVHDWRRNEIEDTYPFYTFAIAQAMDLGELPYNPDWFRVEWIGGAPDVTIDKGRDAAQDRENIKAALDTFKRYYARQGLWWKTELRQKAREAGFIEQVAKEFSVPVDRIHQLATGGAPAPAPDPDDEDTKTTKPAE